MARRRPHLYLPAACGPWSTTRPLSFAKYRPAAIKTSSLKACVFWRLKWSLTASAQKNKAIPRGAAEAAVADAPKPIPPSQPLCLRRLEAMATERDSQILSGPCSASRSKVFSRRSLRLCGEVGVGDGGENGRPSERSRWAWPARTTLTSHLSPLTSHL